MTKKKLLTKQKILVSACFLGERVRYNGVIKPLVHKLLDLWFEQGRLLSLCPEVISGLPVPRPAAEINQISGQFVTVKGENVTKYFEKGAELALKFCQQHKIKFALLKESSPSCGSNSIYDGSFLQTKIVGQGLTTSLLRQNGIHVYCEDTIEQMAEKMAEQIKHSDLTS
jgi:uncharacterized protein YbbK (DUF523 family)